MKVTGFSIKTLNNVYTTRHGYEFVVIETEDELPTRVTFKDAVSDPRFYQVA